MRRGGALHISDNHHYAYRVRLGLGTNNFAEVMALKSLIHFVVEKNIKRLQIYGDSFIIINWDKRTQICHLMRLIPILEEIHQLKLFFDDIVFNHVYREHNRRADELSK